MPLQWFRYLEGDKFFNLRVVSVKVEAAFIMTFPKDGDAN